ncbi:MAG: GTP-dependent nucleic acid-binding protein EngD [Candidatus Curtissbacteria bacterium GW2011_GWC1_44_33]|uniref:GTP-dependent nucleic acid-binding protein EngD n=1 Tax=Candidatus Curtissbacteria bacterium GW2011_GWC1_44_33 TaxID=1618413 RepID=A0A0G1M334_9BACT|nr:MAG: GTP-dependent nucleic acid-binding protein EngD [Candidatus Curtissbacteria bacterium GW2011_GWC1_44_33]
MRSDPEIDRRISGVGVVEFCADIAINTGTPPRTDGLEAKGFIKAEVINVEELLKIGGWRQAKEKGMVRLEGRDYVVQNEDVIEFKIGS